MGRLTAIVLGAAAGGGFPQWNCRCAVCRLAWDGDPRVSARTQASLAVSADGERWTLLNAAPDLRAQLANTPALHPRGALRASPIAAVVLTGAEVDQTAGLLNLRERQPFMLAATAETLGVLGTNTMFDVLAADVVTRRAIEIGKPFVLPGGLTAELFVVPGKVPLYLERGHAADRGRDRRQCRDRDLRRRRAAVLRAGRGGRDAGIAHAAGARRCRPVRRHAVHRRRDDRRRNRREDRAAHGPHADRRRRRLARRARRAWQAAHLHPHQQHQSDPDRRLGRTPRAWRPPAGKSPPTGWRFRCEADDAGRTRGRAARHRREALSPPASVSRAAARRPVHQGPGAGLGAQPLLLSGDDPAEGREPDRALRGQRDPARVAKRACTITTASRRATAASRAGSS